MEQAWQEIMSFFERLKTEASAEWRAYTEHPFIAGLADGTLRQTAFRHYLVQDYLFLIEFARAYALAVYKSPQLTDMREAASGLSAILDVEMNLHVKLCAGWGLSSRDLEQAPPASEMLAYTRYVLDAGMRARRLRPAWSATQRSPVGSPRGVRRTPRRTPIASGSTNMPVRHTKRSRRRRGRTWTGSPISMLHPRVKPSWSRSSRKRPGSRPTSGKWAGARGCVLNILDVAVAQSEKEIEPDGLLDDDARKAVAAVGELIHRTLHVPDSAT
jgi:TENA/THI-4/PQQC family